MIDIHSPSVSLAINLPGDLVAAITRVAAEKHMLLEEVIREACLEYTEPYLWDQTYKEWVQANGPEASSTSGANGKQADFRTASESMP